MLPFTPRTDIRDVARGNAETLGNLRGRSDCRPNLTHDVRRQSRTAVFLALRAARASLSDHVLRIVLVRTDKQMRRITARGVVAVVADEQAARNGALTELIGDPMRKSWLPSLAPHETTAPFRIALRHPWPTAHQIRAIDFLPESLCDLRFINRGRSNPSHQRFPTTCGVAFTNNLDGDPFLPGALINFAFGGACLVPPTCVTTTGAAPISAGVVATAVG